MNCNTQNAKIASITEKTLIIGLDVGVKLTMQELLIGEIMSILRSYWLSVTMKQVF